MAAMTREQFLEIADGPWDITVTGEYLNWGTRFTAAEFKAAQDAYFQRNTAVGWDMHPDEAAVALRGLAGGKEPTYLEVFTALFSSAARDAWWKAQSFGPDGVPTAASWSSWSLYDRYVSALRMRYPHPNANAIAEGKCMVKNADGSCKKRYTDPDPAQTAATLRGWEAAIEARTGVKQAVTPVFPLTGAPPAEPPAPTPAPPPVTPPAPPVTPTPPAPTPPMPPAPAPARPKIPKEVQTEIDRVDKLKRRGEKHVALRVAIVMRDFILTVADRE